MRNLININKDWLFVKNTSDIAVNDGEKLIFHTLGTLSTVLTVEMIILEVLAFIKKL
jgi:hypothetical protein